MSDLPPPAKKPRLSKFGSAHARIKAAKDKAAAGGKTATTAEHAFDARNYHQNANRHGIIALTKFDCPVCQCKNTVVVEPDNVKRQAVVKCVYCMALKPRPAELPYPFTTKYVPRLENRADAFFRFNERYRKLLLDAGGGGCGGAARAEEGVDGGSGGGSLLSGGLLGGLDEVLAGVDGIGSENGNSGGGEVRGHLGGEADALAPPSGAGGGGDHGDEDNDSGDYLYNEDDMADGGEDGGGQPADGLQAEDTPKEPSAAEEDEDEEGIEDFEAFFNDD